jgi:hypothetical protein
MAGGKDLFSHLSVMLSCVWLMKRLEYLDFLNILNRRAAMIDLIFRRVQIAQRSLNTNPWLAVSFQYGVYDCGLVLSRK